MHVSNLHINHVKVILPVWDRLDMSTHTHTQSTNHTVVSGTCSQTYWTNDRYTMHVVILSQTAGFIIKTIPSQIQVHIHKQFPSMTRWLKRRKKWNKRKTFVFFLLLVWNSNCVHMKQAQWRSIFAATPKSICGGDREEETEAEMTTQRERGRDWEAHLARWNVVRGSQERITSETWKDEGG